MQLRELTRNIEVIGPAGPAETEISGIAYDSRKVRKGYLFAAIRGARTDGNLFVDEAIRRGAGAILSENPEPLAFPRPWIRVEHGRRALAQAAANYFGHPTRDLRLVGVTGTNGKTSTAYLLESILRTGGLTGGVDQHDLLSNPRVVGPSGAHHPGKPRSAGAVSSLSAERLPPGGDGGFLSCAGSQPCFRQPIRRGCLHQSVAGTPGLP